MTSVILLLSPIAPKAMNFLESRYKLLKLYETHDAGRVIESKRTSIRAIVAGEKSNLTASFLKRLPNLELLCLPHSRYLELEKELSSLSGLEVVPVASFVPEDYVEMALSLLFGASRRLVEISMIYRARHWSLRTKRPGYRLAGKRFAVFGDERVRKPLESLLEAAGLHRADKESAADLSSLAETLDVLILLPGLTGKEFGPVNLDVFHKLGKRSVIVAIDSGSVIREKDLLMALNNRLIGAIALDSYTGAEYFPDGLLALDNVIVTPGVASDTWEASEEYGVTVCETIDRRFKALTRIE